MEIIQNRKYIDNRTGKKYKADIVWGDGSFSDLDKFVNVKKEDIDKFREALDSRGLLNKYTISFMVILLSVIAISIYLDTILI